jgi:hypothetical protein
MKPAGDSAGLIALVIGLTSMRPPAIEGVRTEHARILYRSAPTKFGAVANLPPSGCGNGP